MGQESSTPIDDSAPTKALESRTLEALAKYITDGHVKKVVVMVSNVSVHLFDRWL